MMTVLLTIGVLLLVWVRVGPTFFTGENTCQAGVGQLVVVRTAILADQPAVRAVLGQCAEAEDERYVEAEVSAGFSCERALSTFSRFYSRETHEPTAVDRRVTDFSGPFVDFDGGRIYLVCGDDYFTLTRVALSIIHRAA
jgi:hypothetical protein